MNDSSLIIIAPVLEVYYRPNPEPTLLDKLDLIRDFCLEADVIYTTDIMARAIYAKNWPLKNEIVFIDGAWDYQKIKSIFKTMAQLFFCRGPHHALFLPSHEPITSSSFQFFYGVSSDLYRKVIKSNYRRPDVRLVNHTTETWGLWSRIYISDSNKKDMQFTTYAPDILDWC